MTKEELAAQLNGNQVGSEISDDLALLAKSSGLVIVFGYSDDNMEFRGAIDDEVGCFDGGSAYVAITGLFDNNECDSECKYFKAARDAATEIEALWCKEKPYSWTYATAIPHVTFDVLENGQPWCRGIVFSLADVRLAS